MKKLLLMLMIKVMMEMVKVVSPPPMSVVEGAEGAAQKMTAPDIKHLQDISNQVIIMKVLNTSK